MNRSKEVVKVFEGAIAQNGFVSKDGFYNAVKTFKGCEDMRLCDMSLILNNNFRKTGKNIQLNYINNECFYSNEEPSKIYNCRVITKDKKVYNLSGSYNFIKQIAAHYNVPLHYSVSKDTFEPINRMEIHHLKNTMWNELDEIMTVEDFEVFVKTNPYFKEFYSRIN